MSNGQHSITTLTTGPTPDPYVIAAHGRLFMTFTAGNRIEIWQTDSLLGFKDETVSKHTIWNPPPNAEYSGGIWAPELHSLNGRWLVYFAAEDPRRGNESHRVYVLGGPPATQDPCAPPSTWEFLGRLRGLPDDQWAIDGTVVTLNNHLFFIYSGWPWNHQGGGGWVRNDKIQELFIVHMADPLNVDTAPSLISRPENSWECSGESRINEGPQWLASPDGRWQGLVYSCAGSWTNEYKMNTIQFLGGEPMNPASWRKSQRPLLQSARGRGPWGPGHGNFVTLGDQVIGVFHATDGPADGWERRRARCQQVYWDSHGQPSMGEVVGHLTDDGAAGGPGQGHKKGFKGFLRSAASAIRDL